jgi:hypothetical protein
LITHHEISASTGVHGIILSSLTSILINVPLIRSMTKEAAFKRKICFELALVAVVGLVGVGLNEMILVFAPRFLAGGQPVRNRCARTATANITRKRSVRGMSESDETLKRRFLAGYARPARSDCRQ